MKTIQVLESKEKFPARKYVFIKNGKSVESTYIDRGNKDIICVSTMFGCPVKCNFCASGNSYLGNLSKEEIISMVDSIIENEGLKNEKKLLIFFMGSGEPLLNADQVLGVIEELIKRGSNFHFAMSVSGINIKNLKLFSHLSRDKLKVQFSLHNPFNEERKNMIPLTEDLDKIFQELSCLKFDTEINYIVLEGINDSERHARELSNFIKKHKFKLKINEYHKIGNEIWESSKKDAFLSILRKNNVDFELYSTDGADIRGACGQLTSRIIKC